MTRKTLASAFSLFLVAMSRQYVVLAILWAGALGESLCAQVPAKIDFGSDVRSHVAGVFGQLPLHFEANLGQTDKQVQFVSHGRGYTLFLTSSEAVLSLQS